MDKPSIVSKSSDILTEFRRLVGYRIERLHPFEPGTNILDNAVLKHGELYGIEPKSKIKLYRKIITDTLIEEIKELQQNTEQVKQLKSKIRNIKKDVRKLCKEENMDLIKNTSSTNKLDRAIQDFDKLCLAVGCKHSFTGACYNN